MTWAAVGAASLVGLVLVFAAVNGANDGAAITSSAVKAPGMTMLTVVVVLTVAVGLVPAVVGTRVADTLRDGLVDVAEGATTAMVVAGVLAGTAVTWLLVRRGLPTSLTLAVVGGIVGVGVGLGGDPRWATVGGVLLVGLAAPVVGGVLAWALAHLPVLGTTASMRAGHPLGTVVQAIAYAANDGQKMIAVAAVAAAVAVPAGGPDVPTWMLAALAGCFAAGTLVGLRSAASTLGGGMLPHRPRQEIIVQFASGAAVLGSAGLGTPVSMTQSIAGGQIGAGLQVGSRRVRWRVATSLGLAWIVTLPAAGVVGAAVGGALRIVAGAPR